MTKTVLDHVAVGTRELADGWDLFGGLLGGSWVYGGDSPGFWWGQVQFRTGPKIELLTPTGGPDAAFLERFLAARGAGPHHFNFIAADIRTALSRVRALGIEPVQVSLDSATWKEAFLRPADAHGIVIQIAQQSGPPPVLAAPARLPAPGPRSAFALVEHYVTDLDGAVRLFEQALDGEVVIRPDTAEASVAELAWQNGARLRLLRATPVAGGAEAVADPAAAVAGGTGPRRGGGLGQLHFMRDGAPFSPADRGHAAELARRLGISLQLGSEI
ncbi:MAG: VOC family protein [Streptosporangiaceae bacterium]